MKKSIAFILVLAMCIGAFATGCASGGKEDSSVIKVGLSMPLTGNMAEYGQQFQVAAQIARDEINANGGIHGKTLEFVEMDSQGDAQQTADIAREFCDNAEIVAVIGDFSSSSCMAAAPIYQENALVQISPTASHADFAPMGDYIFSTVGIMSSESYFMAEKTMQKYLELESCAALYLNSDWGVYGFDCFEEKATEIGIEITAKELFVEGETDFTSVLSKLRQTDPQSLVLYAQYNEAATIIKQVKQMGWDVPIVIAGASCTDQFLELCREDAEGVVSQVPYLFDSEMAFYKSFEEKAGFPPTVFAAYMYDTVYMLAEALNHSDAEITRESVKDALMSYKDFSGIMGAIVFSEDGDIIREELICVVENGAWVRKTDYGY